MGRYFLHLVDSQWNQSCPTIYQTLYRPPQRNHSGSLYLGNTLLKDIHRQHLPDLPRYYQPTLILTGLHEPPPTRNQIHL